MNKKLSVAEGMAELMAILGEAPMKEVAKVAAVTGKSMEQVAGEKATRAAAKEVVEKVGPTVVYEHGRAIVVDGKKVATGPKKRGGARGAKNDAGKDALKEIYETLLKGHVTYGKSTFTHSSEGFIVRLEEADYAIKVSKSKEPKYDITDEDFEVEKDFTARGKAKNSAPGIAKLLYTALDKLEGTTIIIAKASGIVLQNAEGEYTIKISKKRERVGFEAEKAGAY